MPLALSTERYAKWIMKIFDPFVRLLLRCWFVLRILGPVSSFTMSKSFEMNIVDSQARSLGLFRATPLIRSIPLSEVTQRDVYLKLDALQPSGSFKDRGVGHFCYSLQQQGISHLVSSSGGNAGLAVATVGRALHLHVHVVVPTTTKALVVDKLRALQATVTIVGENWNAADEVAQTHVNEHTAYISPYDHPLLWTGHSTLVDEVLAEIKPTTWIVSVGGGGMFCGIMEGLMRHHEEDATTTTSNNTVQVIAAETEGASSFAQAWQTGEIVRLDAIQTIATSLGALSVTPECLTRGHAFQQRTGGTVQEAICTDAEAVQACWSLAQDHRILVEPACGAALAVVYSERLRTKLLQNNNKGPIVVEICGGSGVSIDLLQQWKRDLVGKTA